MQKLILIYSSLCFIMLNTSIAQTTGDNLKDQATDEFKSTLLDNFMDYDTAKTFGDMIAPCNRAKLIANKWSDQWAAQYYATYMLTVLSYIEKDETKKDSYLDEAEVFFKKTKDLYKKSSDEMFVMAALIANARLAVKPANRYKKFGEIFSANIDSAKKLNVDNPRIYYLQGNSIFYTPKFFGGGAKNAQPYYEKAAGLYVNEKSDDIFKPYWGKKRNEDMLKQCKEENK